MMARTRERRKAKASALALSLPYPLPRLYRINNARFTCCYADLLQAERVFMFKYKALVGLTPWHLILYHLYTCDPLGLEKKMQQHTHTQTKTKQKICSHWLENIIHTLTWQCEYSPDSRLGSAAFLRDLIKTFVVWFRTTIQADMMLCVQLPPLST